MEVCPRCGARLTGAADLLFCTACGFDLGLEPTSLDAVPAGAASSSDLLRSLLDLAALREPRRRDAKPPPGGTAVYGREDTVRMRVVPEAQTWDVDPAPAAPIESPPASTRLRSLADAETLLCARVQGDPSASKRVVDLLCLVAAADGEVDDDEATALARTMSVLLGGELHDAVVKLLITGSLKEIQSHGFDAKVTLVASALKTYDAVDEGLMLAIAMAYASGGFSGPERGVVFRLARAMGVRDDRVAALLAAVRREVDPG